VSTCTLLSFHIVNGIQYNNLTAKSCSYYIELLFIVLLLIFRSHVREMVRRKIHNREKMIEVEIKRTHDLLENLVPPPVLEGIKSDQKVVDELEDVTLLFTDMVGFTDFSKKNSAKTVIKLLSDLFTRFD
jgi:hypothetical protein